MDTLKALGELLVKLREGRYQHHEQTKNAPDLPRSIHKAVSIEFGECAALLDKILGEAGSALASLSLEGAAVTLSLLACDTCTWQTHTGFSSEGQPCTNPAGCPGHFERREEQPEPDSGERFDALAALGELYSLMRSAAMEHRESAQTAPDARPRSLHMAAAERLNGYAGRLEQILHAVGLASALRPFVVEGEGQQAIRVPPIALAEPEPGVNELLAARLYEVLRLKLEAQGIKAMEFTPQPLELVRPAFVATAAQLIADAREEREEWTREYIAREAERMRAMLETSRTPGRFATFPHDLSEKGKD